MHSIVCHNLGLVFADGNVQSGARILALCLQMTMSTFGFLTPGLVVTDDNVHSQMPELWTCSLLWQYVQSGARNLDLSFLMTVRY